MQFGLNIGITFVETMKVGTQELQQLETSLAAIVRANRHAADDALDFRDSVMHAQTPGRCVQCYFKILSKAKRVPPQEVTTLRRWLEERILVQAEGRQYQYRQRYRLSLDFPDLESCCRAHMEQARQRTETLGGDVMLRFAFNDALQAAV
ncbi:MAG: hypothetical protein E1N59_578 [Puniceicoccaceae bacterium 5H]|nr:MAG: hypothetical protein E1N59_578 [Puniceicoccaceae bacterium 5H]